MDKKWILAETKEVSVQAAFNPAIPRSEGFHVVLMQKRRWSNAEVVPGIPLGELPRVTSPWTNPELYSRMSEVAARVCAVVMELRMADWCNIHCDGNIGAAKGEPVMHIHIFGRLKASPSWGGPLQLPRGEGPYGNDPLTEEERERLRSALADRL